MKKEIKKTYRSFLEDNFNSLQKEYTKETPLLDDDGNLLSPGFARRMLFTYERDKVKPKIRRKEWEYYLIYNGDFQVLVSFANITILSFAGLSINELHKQDPTKKHSKATIIGQSTYHLGEPNKYILPSKGDVENSYNFHVTGLGKPIDLKVDTKETKRLIDYKSMVDGKEFSCHFEMDILKDLENLTTVIPFKDDKTSFFMTMKQNSMPTEGYVKYGDSVWNFSKENSFCSLDWGRVCAPRRVNWYWGNSSTYLYDKDGNKHLFGFEITWAIGDESYATETALFYDGKLHKIKAVDVKEFPKNVGYLKDWVVTSEDERFEMTMTPFYDHFTDTNIGIIRMTCHQAHGLFNGRVVLDDGTVLEIKDMYGFIEYVENKW